MEEFDFAKASQKYEKQYVAPKQEEPATSYGMDDISDTIRALAKRFEGSFTREVPAKIPSTERKGGRAKGFQFKLGDVTGNIRQLLHVAESPDYITLAGGKKVRELKDMTVAEIGKTFGNKAAGKYQIQRDTALDMLRREKIDPSTFRFDREGQDRLFEMLLKHRGKLDDYKAGKISKEQFAKNLSTVWAGLPRDISGKSNYDKVQNNKAHISWKDFLAALD